MALSHTARVYTANKGQRESVRRGSRQVRESVETAVNAGQGSCCHTCVQPGQEPFLFFPVTSSSYVHTRWLKGFKVHATFKQWAENNGAFWVENNIYYFARWMIQAFMQAHLLTSLTLMLRQVLVATINYIVTSPARKNLCHRKVLNIFIDGWYSLRVMSSLNAPWSLHPP